MEGAVGQMCNIKPIATKKVDVLIAALNRVADALEASSGRDPGHGEGKSDAGGLRRGCLTDDPTVR